MVEQFWTYIIWQDDNGKEEEIHHSILVSALEFSSVLTDSQNRITDVFYVCLFVGLHGNHALWV